MDNITPDPARMTGCPVAHGGAAAATAALRETQRFADDGYFGPGSMSQRLYSEPSTKLAGVAALLLQALNPMMMRVFAGTSWYETDMEGRATRTGQYLDTTIFGDRAHADAAGEAVQRLHARSTWTDPRTGDVLRADTPEWLVWTHNTLVWSILNAADVFGPTLTVAEQDQFVAEQHQAARIVGIDPESEKLASTRATLDEYIHEQRHWMALSLPAAEVSRELRKPGLKGNPIEIWTRVVIQDAILYLLPDWARLLYGIEGRPMNLRAAAASARKIITKARTSSTAADRIAEVTERTSTHPYRKVRRKKVNA